MLSPELRAGRIGDSEDSQGDYNAAQFLRRNGLRVRITYKDNAAAPWAKDGRSGNRYRVTVWRDGKSGRMAFNFWGSMADAANGEAPAVDCGSIGEGAAIVAFFETGYNPISAEG